MFFEDLEGFEGINGQMKKSVDMTFINKKNQLWLFKYLSNVAMGY